MWQSRWFRAALLLVLAAILVGWLIKSQLPQWMARWHWYSATQHETAGDLDKALEAYNQALAWQPDAPDLYEARAKVQVRRGKLQEALEDCDMLLRLNPNYPRGYKLRSSIHLVLRQYDEALEDAKTLKSWLESSDHEGFNHVAYTRAVASGDAEELATALEEVETALKLLGHDLSEKLLSEDAQLQLSDVPFGNYLDTRGYIYYRQGKYKEALADLDKAITLLAGVKQAVLAGSKDQPTLQQRAEEIFNPSLRIMYQHRGLVWEKLGDAKKAQADKEMAQQLGYDPSRDGE